MSAETQQARRKRLYLFQGGLCYLCAEPMAPARLRRSGERLRKRDPTFDHVIPRWTRLGSRGNLLLAHSRCNNRKADAPPPGCAAVWLDLVAARAAAPPLAKDLLRRRLSQLERRLFPGTGVQ